MTTQIPAALFADPAPAPRLERAAAALTAHGFAVEILDAAAAARTRIKVGGSWRREVPAKLGARWCGWSRAGVWRWVCCPCAGRRRDRFQGGAGTSLVSRRSAWCGVWVARVGVTGHDRGVLPVTPVDPGAFVPGLKSGRWG